MTLKIPPLSEKLSNINSDTLSYCRMQISAFTHKPTKQLPEYGGNHDILVGSYICGFLQGQLIVSGALKEWSDGEEGLEALGWLTMSTVCVNGILGSRRMLNVQPHLPQMAEVPQTEDVMLLDRAGGHDGMDYAKGIKTENGGWLLHYLSKNVNSDAIEVAAEKSDLAAIAANPLSAAIYNNGKLFLIVASVIIVSLLFAGG